MRCTSVPARGAYSSFTHKGVLFHRLHWWDENGAYSTKTFECEHAMNRYAVGIKLCGNGEGS